MLIKTINKALKPLGFKIISENNFRNFAQVETTGKGYTLYSYLKKDGSFDYEKYKNIQVEGNKRKIENIWVVEDNIKFLSEYLKNKINKINFGICHGTRRGKEQEWFKKYIGGDIRVIGTEISDTALEFPDTIQWDFHNVKPEWLGTVDFIYSNSFDHSYDPEKCLLAWMSCLKSGGLCILEHTDAHTDKAVNELDPFGASIAQMPFLISEWGKGDFSVREILQAPRKNDDSNYTAFVVIQKF